MLDGPVEVGAETGGDVSVSGWSSGSSDVADFDPVTAIFRCCGRIFSIYALVE